MDDSELHSAAGLNEARRLFVYNAGFLTQRRMRRILSLAGWSVSLGYPKEGDAVGVWGKSPTAHRGERIAESKDCLLYTSPSPRDRQKSRMPSSA